MAFLPPRDRVVLRTNDARVEEWTTTLVPWLPRKLKERVEDFARNLKGGLVPSDSHAYGHLRPPA